MLRKTILAMVAVASVAMLSTSDASARGGFGGGGFHGGGFHGGGGSVWASASDLLVPMAAGDTVLRLWVSRLCSLL